MYYYTGYVNKEGIPVERTVYLYRRSTGELVGSAVSSGTNGYFEISSSYSGYHYAVILPKIGDGYNPIIIDQILPQ